MAKRFKLGEIVTTANAERLISEVLETYPFGQRLDEWTAQTVVVELNGFTYNSLLTINESVGAVLAMTSVQFPSQVIGHRHFPKGMKRFLKLMAKQPNFLVRFDGSRLNVVFGMSSEKSTVADVREALDATFEIANHGIGGLLKYIFR